MNLEPTLTKENFWNEMMDKYPKAIAKELVKVKKVVHEKLLNVNFKW